MLKGLVNLILFIVIAIFFLIATSQGNLIQNTPQNSVRTLPQNSTLNTNYFEENPILITPSNIRIVDQITRIEESSQISRNTSPRDTKNNTDLNLSPNGSIGNSTIADINIEYKRSDSLAFVFTENGRKFGSIGERLCCKVFEEFLGRTCILHLRPNFLKNPLTNRNLELDMYDPIGIAIEYNGKQHSSYVPMMHSSIEEFEKQKYRDNLKVSLCEKNNVILIIVDYKIDNCCINEFGVERHVRLNEYQRELKIKNFLIPKLKTAIDEIESR